MMERVLSHAVTSPAFRGRAALTLLLAPISYGNIQCRVSEAFTVLPMVLPQSIPGLFVGCLIANIFSPVMPSGAVDAVA